MGMIWDVLCDFTPGMPRSLLGKASSAWWSLRLYIQFRIKRSMISSYVMPNAFIAAVIRSEKKMGSTRSTMSPATSKK